MPPPRPRNSINNTISSIGGRPGPSAPMSERQQMALLMQMTSSTSPSSTSGTDFISNGNLAGQCPVRSRDRNERGETALHVAAIKGDQEGVKKLLESGMSPNIEDFAGWSPLHEACNHSHYNVALTLIKAGANVNAKGLEDDTPLHDAVVTGNVKIVTLLIENGADAFRKNKKGKSPICIAPPNVMQYLMSVGDINTRNSNLKKPFDKKSDELDETNNNPLNNQAKESVDDFEIKKNLTKDDDKDIRRIEKACDDKNTDDKSLNPSSSICSTTSNTIPAPSKRTYSDVENSEEGNESEDSKRKKRKDSETKDIFKRNTATSSCSFRVDKKPSNAQSKNNVSTSVKTNNSDRKSPCTSPKTITKCNDSDVETEETKTTDAFVSAGPKVPPLKIVIPQQNSSNDNDGLSRNGKSNSNRNHQALPYVVPSLNTSNSNDCVVIEKEFITTCNSPTEGGQKLGGLHMLTEEKFGKATSEERAQQRVLRSSHRSGQNSDRNSNNSSPQLQSSSPSPAQPPSNDSNDHVQKSVNTTTPSPSAQSIQIETESLGNVPSPSASSTSSTKDNQSIAVELHPRKRKIRAKQEEHSNKLSTSVNVSNETTVNSSDIHPHDHPFTNCYQMYLNIRKQIEKKHKTLLKIQPRPPQCFNDYLLNRKTYLLASKVSEPIITTPLNLIPLLNELFITQERERHKLRRQHIVEKEKLALNVEQEILRVHSKAARISACQSTPLSVCTFLKDQEVYNLITPEQEEKDRNARSRYNGRLFLSWLQDVDDKWEKIKEALLLRHHNEAESLHAVQKMDWECAMKERALCDLKSQPEINECHVPMVHVSDEFDILPA